MVISQTFNLFKLLEKDDSVLTFKGIITEELLTSVLQIMEMHLANSNHPPNVKKESTAF